MRRKVKVTKEQLRRRYDGYVIHYIGRVRVSEYYDLDLEDDMCIRILTHRPYRFYSSSTYLLFHYDPGHFDVYSFTIMMSLLLIHLTTLLFIMLVRRFDLGFMTS